MAYFLVGCLACGSEAAGEAAPLSEALAPSLASAPVTSPSSAPAAATLPAKTARVTAQPPGEIIALPGAVYRLSEILDAGSSAQPGLLCTVLAPGWWQSDPGFYAGRALCGLKQEPHSFEKIKAAVVSAPVAGGLLPSAEGRALAKSIKRGRSFRVLTVRPEDAYAPTVKELQGLWCTALTELRGDEQGFFSGTARCAQQELFFYGVAVELK